MGDSCKPEEVAFQKVIDDIGAKATECVMFEDSIKNVVAASGMGMKTVFVRGRDPEQGFVKEGEGGQERKVIDCACDKLTIENLKEAKNFLW